VELGLLPDLRGDISGGDGERTNKIPSVEGAGGKKGSDTGVKAMSDGFVGLAEHTAGHKVTELERRLREGARAEATPPRKRQGGLVAGTAHTRVPEELLKYAGILGIPIQAQAMYVHVAFFDRGRGKPFVGLTTIAGRMGMSRGAAWHWYEWWKDSGLLVASSTGRRAAAGVPGAAPHHATEWDWTPLYKMLFLIREAGESRDMVIAEYREKIERVVHETVQSRAAPTVHETAQSTVQYTGTDCTPRELGARGNPGETPPKQETETRDIQETTADGRESNTPAAGYEPHRSPPESGEPVQLAPLPPEATGGQAESAEPSRPSGVLSRDEERAIGKTHLEELIEQARETTRQIAREKAAPVRRTAGEGCAAQGVRAND